MQHTTCCKSPFNGIAKRVMWGVLFLKHMRSSLIKTIFYVKHVCGLEINTEKHPKYPKQPKRRSLSNHFDIINERDKHTKNETEIKTETKNNIKKKWKRISHMNEKKKKKRNRNTPYDRHTHKGNQWKIHTEHMQSLDSQFQSITCNSNHVLDILLFINCIMV